MSDHDAEIAALTLRVKALTAALVAYSEDHDDELDPMRAPFLATCGCPLCIQADAALDDKATARLLAEAAALHRVETAAHMLAVEVAGFVEAFGDKIRYDVSTTNLRVLEHHRNGVRDALAQLTRVRERK